MQYIFLLPIPAGMISCVSPYVFTLVFLDVAAVCQYKEKNTLRVQSFLDSLFYPSDKIHIRSY